MQWSFFLFLVFYILHSLAITSPYYVWPDLLQTDSCLDKQLKDSLFWEFSCKFVGITEKAVDKQSTNLAHRFSLWELAPSLGKDSIIVLIDTGLYSPYVCDQKYIQKHHINLLNDKFFCPSSLISQHGTHLHGLIVGQIDSIGCSNPISNIKKRIGIAPRAQVIMIRAFSSDGTAQLSTLIQALELAHTKYKADIVCLGLKIGDDESSIGPLKTTFETCLKNIPWVIAAAGNDGDSEEIGYVGRKVAYPGCLSCVPLSVGAMGMKSGSYIVPAFSQSNRQAAPTVLAPGVSIASSVYLKREKERLAYLFMDGTSCATALVAGFMGLVISEFKHDFTQDQIQAVVYASCCIPNDNFIDRSRFGVIDMRMTLLVLHVLRFIKKSVLNIYFESFFKNFMLNSLDVIQNVPYKKVQCNSLNAMIKYISDDVLLKRKLRL